MNASTTKNVVGIDLGDKYSVLCTLDEAGEIVEQSRIRTMPAGFASRLEHVSRCRVVLEAGTHSPWVSRQIEGYGHEVVVANPRRVALIYREHTKTDEIDAEVLARLGRIDPQLLSPIRHRAAETLNHRALISARTAVVRSRTRLIQVVRGIVKSHGLRLNACGAASFATKMRGQIPPELDPALSPLIETIDQLTRQLRAYDREIERVCATAYPETALLQQITGVGPITALYFVLTIEDPNRFASSRSVASYLGLRPRRSQSGASDPQMRITKAGNGEMRRLLVHCAQYILGPFGPDCDLRRFGERIAARGGKTAKKRAVVAVARKLAVLMHRLWVTAETYEPLRNVAQSQAAA